MGLLTVPWLMLLAAISCVGQTSHAAISVVSNAPGRAHVEGESRTPERDFSFLQSYAGAQGLGQRIDNFSAMDAAGNPIKVSRLAPGEYTAERPAAKWAYDVDLRPPEFPADAAYVSWVTAERGLLMLKDLLPLPARGADGASDPALDLTISAPAGWQIATVENATAPGHFSLNDWTSAVFFVSPAHRQSQRRFEAVTLTVVSSGPWAFTDNDVFEMAGGILRYHQQTVGDTTPFSAMLIVAPFPTALGGDRWSAETRGRTVVLLSGQSPARLPALAKLSVSLTHELFHLWIPNRLHLEGDYAWFFEGFTLYQALRCGISLGYFTFGDFLNALARAFDVYRRAPNFDQLTLAQAGERRWTGGNSLVYNKGLLAAFLLDASLRLHGGKRALSEVYRELLGAHGWSQPAAPADAAIVAELQKDKNSAELVRTLITGAGAIDLRALIAPDGLQLDEAGGRTVLSAAPNLSRGQRDLLREFGYNP